jgi:FdhD protein
MQSSVKKTIETFSASSVTPNVTCNFFSGEEWHRETVAVPSEMPLTIFINGQEIATILCTPTRLTQLVLGFLYSEGIIANRQEVASLRVCEDEPIADVRLTKAEYTVPAKRTLTSGCGSGVSFGTQVVLAEDIGRHNTLDKIMGECLMRGLPTQDCILLTTGRISSEMLIKAARMQTPIVVSRGSPTERAIALGNELGVTVIGYARGSRLSVFSGEERLPFANSQD